MPDAAELIFALLIALSLSACCGLRAFLPLATISVLGWTGHLTLATGFDWLAEPTTALALSLAALIEIIADKVPGLDNALDAAGLVIKPLAGTLLASSLIVGMDPLLGVTLGLIVGGGTAGVTHAAKAQLRLFSTGLTGGIGNPVLSAAEDGTAAAFTALGLLVPLLTSVVVLIALWWLVRRMLRRRRSVQAVSL